MMKKLLSVLMAALFVFGCLSVGVFAVDGEAEEPVKTDSGYYVGQRIKAGDTIKSVHDTCESLMVVYAVSADDAENVSSALQTQFADPSFVGVVTFRDNIASFTSGDLYAGTYTVKGIGDEVDEMEITNGTYKTATDIYGSLTKEEKEALDKKLKKQTFALTVDYDYAKTTYYQYTTVTEWEVSYVNETEKALSFRLTAVYETREPNGFETVVEKVYVKWLEFLDKLGDFLLPIVPQIVHYIATLLGKDA
ncbi:MAG: hypothetical protein IJT44_05505 [Clostridia bacterium]|nr:hypothetical protein [Clostridia bacterium]